MCNLANSVLQFGQSCPNSKFGQYSGQATTDEWVGNNISVNLAIFAQPLAPINPMKAVPTIAKRWSCAVDMFSTNNGARGSVSAARNASIIAARRSRCSVVDDYDEDEDDPHHHHPSLATLFDPNDRRYRCCCGHSHAKTGVRIIAGLLGVTVLLELWQLCWHLLSPAVAGPAHPSSSSYSITSSLVQLLFGLFIVGTVVLALHLESAPLLLPYLLLQGVGLVAVFIISLALFYVVLDNDLPTIRAFVETHGPVTGAAHIEEKELVFMGWTLCLSCLCLLALQLWLISIVLACWRYLRDKRASSGGTSVPMVALDHLQDETLLHV